MFHTVPELFLHRIAATPDAEAFQYPIPDGGGSAWAKLTWREVGDRVHAIASGLRSIGLTDEQRVALLASTRIEWILIDLGILCAGGATTTIYPQTKPEDCAYIIN